MTQQQDIGVYWVFVALKLTYMKQLQQYLLCILNTLNVQSYKKSVQSIKMLQNQKMKRKQNKPAQSKRISSATKLPIINNKKNLSNIPQNLSVNVSSYQDEGLITLIQQFMLKNNLFYTLQVFQKDCLKGFKQSTKSVDALKKQLVQAFDSGNRQLFLVKFSQYVPLSMRTKDLKTLKMQFYVQLYLFIYCIHPSLGKKKTIDNFSKQGFISYLEGRGSALAKQQQFLPFYALAYLPKPQQNQTFKSLFTKQWVTDIRKQLLLFIDKLYPPGRSPTIVSMYDKFIQSSLEGQKNQSSINALTQPDEQYYQPPIEQMIEQNFQQNIMNNPQPVLLQNRSNGSNKVMKNNSLQKYSTLNVKMNSQQRIDQHSQLQQQPTGLFNGQNSTSKLNSFQQQPSDKQRQQIIQFNDKVNQLQEERDRLLQFIENSKNKYQNLQNDFKQFSESIKNILLQSQNKWFKIIQQLHNVGMDLLNAANNLQQGLPLIDGQILLKRGEKLERYKPFVSMNIQDLLSDNVADYSLFERPQHDLSVDMVKKNVQHFQRDQKFIQIDFQKIKSVLGQTVDPQQMSQQQVKQLYLQKCLILQAMRWRMTTIRGVFQKRQVVLSFTLYDVLGITEDNQRQNQRQGQTGDESVVNVLLNCQNQMVLLQTVLLVSALSKDYYGREYLFSEKLMIKFMQLRKMPEVDQRIKGVILIIFQQQSTKKSCQTLMIDNGLIEDIVQKLDKQRDQMNSFDMQYTSALLLNLLLTKGGLDRAQLIKSQVLMTLINLMQTQHSSVKSFVHASLYPLLSRKVIREKALQFGMEQNIKYLLQNCPVDFQHQLRYIQERLMMQGDQQQERQDEPEYDEINDQQLGEDIQFVIEEISGRLTGEFLLMKKYPLTGPDAMQQMSKVREQVKVTFSKDIYFDRDVTERLSVQTPLLGKGRKSQIQPTQRGGFTRNHSVYSNKSSNRALKSQKNSRIKNPPNNNKQRLDTVHQNNSQTSLKQLYQQPRGEQLNYKFRSNKSNDVINLENNSFEKSKLRDLSKRDNTVQILNAEDTFRPMQKQQQQSPVRRPFAQDRAQRQTVINQNARIINELNPSYLSNKEVQLDNQSFTDKLQQQNAQQANLRNKKLKPYQQSQDFVKAFQTRAMLVRTPPQKPS